MPELLPINVKKASVTMSSREIAELTHKEHKNVLRVIRDLIEQNLVAQIEPLKFEYRNQWFDYYELNKRDTLVVVARLSPEFTAAVIDRWQTLENQQKPTALHLSRKELALMIIQAEEENERLQLENKYQAVQIQAMENYFRNGISPFEFVKGLNGVNSLKIGAFLVGKNWLYQEGNHKRVKHYARDLYLTEETTEIAQHGREPFLAYKPVLLKKGAAKIYEWYIKGILPMKTSWNGEFTQDKAVGL
ncbi:Rha family transcriptional regulator [Volucribacter amazonae]|uniref:Antirepressor n=1 Tax=Volucribacter amazonae TaxID=256731 RepID=A0A9X4PMQ9_9PAST|nr:Rha family transcriptional regulator [Volucribacter amazonae]MDG6894548.1 antirepressor [Volucribacter amazonae]